MTERRAVWLEEVRKNRKGQIGRQKTNLSLVSLVRRERVEAFKQSRMWSELYFYKKIILTAYSDCNKAE
jgi:hypothetical protein